MKRSFLLTITALVYTTLPACSQTPPVQSAAHGQTNMAVISDPGVFGPIHAPVEKGLASSWSSSRLCKGSCPIIKFTVADDGKIYEPEMVRYSADDQYDAECLEAICSLSPISLKIENRIARLEHFTQQFGLKGDLQPSYDGSDVNAYLRTHIQPKDKHDAFIVVHRIPLTVLDRYPGMFTKEELQGQNNLMEIRVGFGDNKADNQGIRSTAPHFVIAIANLYAFWGQLFKNPDVTKEAILQWAKHADKNAH